MGMVATIFIALGLAADAFAVSVASGMAIEKVRISSALKIAIFFGSFQAIMPLIGWLGGLTLRGFIAGLDHWIAFGLLSFIGCRMIYESIRIESSPRKINPLNTYALLMLSVATSIDALAVGVSFAFLKIFVPVAIIVIGIVTFLLSFFGTFIGDRFGRFFERQIETAGGLILVGIGTKILVEHLI